MPERHRFRWLFLTLCVVALVGDLTSKYGVFRWLYPLPNREADVIPGWFKFTAQYDPTTKPSDGILNPLQTWSAPEMPFVNKGALFGFLNDQKELANALFAGISAIAAILISLWVARSAFVKYDRWLCAALGLILGGAVGNCFDRIVFHGVRDFLYFYRVEYPVFNFADCCLVVGTLFLILHSFLVKEPKPAAVTTTVNSPNPIPTAIV
jgi:signal peptidase II